MTQSFALSCHPDTPCAAVETIAVTLTRHVDGALELRYRIAGQIDALRVPPQSPPTRSDALWRHTCCELFISDGAETYREYNFAPSGCWAAWQFTDYRTGRHDMPQPVAPQIERAADAHTLTLTARCAAVVAGKVAIAAVIETLDGALSYWALRHPPGRADFHHAAGFIELEL